MSAEGAQAVTRLVDLCETFHLPIVSLTDQAGMSIGSAAERHGDNPLWRPAIAAIYQARVPQAELILAPRLRRRRRRHRSTAIAPAGAGLALGRWGSLPAQGGIEAAFRAQLRGVPNREAELARIRPQLERISVRRSARRSGSACRTSSIRARAGRCSATGCAKCIAFLPEQLGRASFGMRP